MLRITSFGSLIHSKIIMEYYAPKSGFIYSFENGFYYFDRVFLLQNDVILVIYDS